MAFTELIAELEERYPAGQPILGESAQKDFIRLYGSVLRLRNILSAFDDFAGKEILTERRFQDYQSTYIDMYQNFRKRTDGDKESINEDVVFEMELVRQIEVNIDYILVLVEKYRASHCENKEILKTIDKTVMASMSLRSKKDLIERFIERVNTSSRVDEDWRQFLQECRETEMESIIEDKNLKPDETRRLLINAFRDGMLKTTGTAQPPISRFEGGGRRSDIKQGIIDRLLTFFEKYGGA